METLEGFHQVRRIMEDFVERSLASLAGDYARLLYTASLRDLASGKYEHQGLAAVYPQEAVQQALAQCHTELFLRLLETPLERQEWDLRTCLAGLEGDFWGVVRRWKELESYRILIPEGVPPYIQEFFCANVQTLLALFLEEDATVRASA